MPISVLPTPPDFPPSKPPGKANISNGANANYTSIPSSSSDPITALKQAAKASVQQSAKGASAIGLLKAARAQYMQAGIYENEGDLQGALTAFTKAAGLAHMVFGTPEWRADGVRKEFSELMEGDDINLTSRMQAVEAKLRMVTTEEQNSRAVSQKSGGSIADRMKALQDSGLSISTNKSKRFSKDLHLNGINGVNKSPVSSPTVSSPRILPNDSLSTLTALSPPPNAPGASSYSHAFVSPSSFGPPSPGSSPSSSPTLPSTAPSRSFSTSSEYNAFNSHFPSIDELDELDGITPLTSLPSVPTGRSTASNKSIAPMATGGSVGAGKLRSTGSASSLKSQKSAKDLNLHITGESPKSSPLSPSPSGPVISPLASHAALRNFIVPVERPSSVPSTPLRSSGGVWDSRPNSPVTKYPQPGSPRTVASNITGSGKVPPAVPVKPSALSTSRSMYGNFDDPIPGEASTSNLYPSSSPSASSSPLKAPGSPIPQKNSCSPQELYGYLREYKVILLDVRDRAEFEQGHIHAGKAMGSVVCVEPAVLNRGTVTSENIEDALVLAPPSEAPTFNNRHKFDLVVIYDRNSTSFTSVPLAGSTTPHPSSISLVNGNNDASSSTPGSNANISALLRAIWEREFKKPLRRMPMMLIGGYEAWVKEMGEGEVVSSAASGLSGSSSAASMTMTPPSSVHSPLMSPSLSYQGGASSSGSRLRAGTSPGSSSALNGHKNNYSLDGLGHSRNPAESSPASSSASSAKSGRATPTTSTPLSPHLSGISGRRPAAVGRTSFSTSSSSGYPATTAGSMSTLSEGTTLLNGATPISYPSFTSSTYSLPSAMSSSAVTPSTAYSSVEGLASPPQASINPTIPRRRTSDYMDQSQEALSGALSPNGPGSANGYTGMGMNGFGAGVNGINGYSGGYNNTLPRKPIDYPELSTHHILRPPPAAAAGTLERRTLTTSSSSPSATGSSIPAYSSTSSPSLGGAAGITASTPYAASALVKLGLPPLNPVPRLKGGDWPPRYWADSPIGTSGLKNMGNTCYMNAPIQCLSATVPFARFFTEIDLKSVINYMNKMNSQGQLTRAFSRLIHDIWHGEMPYITPNDFRRTLCSLNKQYIGTSQHDSQEFLSFLLDGIHEDTNRIMARKPVTRTPEEEERLEQLEGTSQQLAAEYEWQVWRQSNDSIIVDFFQGMFRNQLRCMSCDKTSTTYNAFSILSLPVPARTGKIPLQNCLKAFFNVEVMEGDDAWDCTRCETKRRATKSLSLARLPPVLVVHFKRFEANGRFSDKIDTFVDFPMKSLDLTDLMPPPLPTGADQSLLNGNGLSMDDPRMQVGPYKYDLYGVTNHYGNLSSGHYTAFVASRGGWLYYDDSSVKNVDAKQVVNQKAYVLFYKRVKA
ncbi:hypothetical protein BDP27DRAFT_1327038 [Rhodocollybia butyracea]|uniref:ubiquitinyl hydrolase 1 n=1 Tax=Rhodocollybia butyracea TaxID=206335 RepID=A0A9P5PU95_9AGAR|nr:hypothetical protein BDP27DRAFT_1327038 [Rhodocollybia butyracea]